MDCRSCVPACCIQSMSRKGNYYDNSVMETFFGRLKTEIYYGFEKEYSSFNTFVVAIEEYINYYNNKRIKKIRTTRKTGGLLTGYKPVVLGQRLKALAFTTFKPHSH